MGSRRLPPAPRFEEPEQQACKNGHEGNTSRRVDLLDFPPSREENPPIDSCRSHTATHPGLIAQVATVILPSSPGDQTPLPTLAGCGFSPATVTPNTNTMTTTLTIHARGSHRGSCYGPGAASVSAPAQSAICHLAVAASHAARHSGDSCTASQKTADLLPRVPAGRQLPVAGSLRWREQRWEWRRWRHGRNPSWNLRHHRYWRGGFHPAHDDRSVRR